MKLTAEAFAALVAEVISRLTARSESGSDDAFTEGAINEVVAEVLEETVGDDENGEDGEDGKKSSNDSTGVPDDLIAQIMSALSSAGAKAEAEVHEEKNEGTENEPEQKARQTGPQTPPLQRKYANIFIPQNIVSGPRGGADFKSRIENLTGPARRKETYGAFGRAVKCINSSGGDSEKAAFVAERTFRDQEMAQEFKALSTVSPSEGGYLIPDVYANEIIEMLYPSTVIYALGARRLGMENGNMNVPKIKAGTRAMFSGESRAIPKTTPTFGNLRLSSKKLTALIPQSNDLLRSTNFDNDVIVGQDIVKQMALGVDFGALLGTGGEFQPLGIAKNSKVAKIDATKIDELYASTDGKLTAAFPNYIVATVLKNNVYADGLGFVFNTSVEQYFKSLRDSVGGFIFAQEMNKEGTLAGYPYRATNILESEGGKTCIIFGNWNDLIIGEQGALQITTSQDGTWTDSAGKIVSAFEHDQTLIRAINNMDAGLRHEESFAVATNVAVPV